jgi:hypothetical protein
VAAVAAAAGGVAGGGGGGEGGCPSEDSRGPSGLEGWSAEGERASHTLGILSRVRFLLQERCGPESVDTERQLMLRLFVQHPDPPSHPSHPEEAAAAAAAASKLATAPATKTPVKAPASRWTTSRKGMAAAKKKKAKHPVSDEDESSEEESSSEESSSADDGSDCCSDVSDDPDRDVTRSLHHGAAGGGVAGGGMGANAKLGGAGAAGSLGGPAAGCEPGHESSFSTRLSSIRRQAFKVSQRSGIDNRKLRMIRMDALQDSDLIRMEALVANLLGQRRALKSAESLHGGKQGSGTRNHTTVTNYSLLRQKLRATIAAPAKGALSKMILHRGGGVDGRKAAAFPHGKNKLR